MSSRIGELSNLTLQDKSNATLPGMCPTNSSIGQTHVARAIDQLLQNNSFKGFFDGLTTAVTQSPFDINITEEEVIITDDKHANYSLKFSAVTDTDRQGLIDTSKDLLSKINELYRQCHHHCQDLQTPTASPAGIDPSRVTPIPTHSHGEQSPIAGTGVHNQPSAIQTPSVVVLPQSMDTTIPARRALREPHVLGRQTNYPQNLGSRGSASLPQQAFPLLSSPHTHVELPFTQAPSQAPQPQSDIRTFAPSRGSRVLSLTEGLQAGSIANPGTSSRASSSSASYVRALLPTLPAPALEAPLPLIEDPVTTPRTNPAASELPCRSTAHVSADLPSLTVPPLTGPLPPLLVVSTPSYTPQQTRTPPESLRIETQGPNLDLQQEKPFSPTPSSTITNSSVLEALSSTPQSERSESTPHSVSTTPTEQILTIQRTEEDESTPILRDAESIPTPEPLPAIQTRTGPAGLQTDESLRPQTPTPLTTLTAAPESPVALAPLSIRIPQNNYLDSSPTPTPLAESQRRSTLQPTEVSESPPIPRVAASIPALHPQTHAPSRTLTAPASPAITTGPLIGIPASDSMDSIQTPTLVPQRRSTLQPEEARIARIDQILDLNLPPEEELAAIANDFSEKLRAIALRHGFSIPLSSEEESTPMPRSPTSLPVQQAQTRTGPTELQLSTPEARSEPSVSTAISELPVMPTPSPLEQVASELSLRAACLQPPARKPCLVERKTGSIHERTEARSLHERRDPKVSELTAAQKLTRQREIEKDLKKQELAGRAAQTRATQRALKGSHRK